MRLELTIKKQEIESLKKSLFSNSSTKDDLPIEQLAQFFEEVAAEIRIGETNSYSMMHLIAEVNKAMIHTQEDIEHIEDRERENASY